jgi:hypothetical protein
MLLSRPSVLTFKTLTRNPVPLATQDSGLTTRLVRVADIQHTPRILLHMHRIARSS